MSYRFQKKPVIVEAFQITDETRYDNSNWPSWLHEAWNKNRTEKGACYSVSEDQSFGKGILVHTEEGIMLCSIGDFIIRGIEGELYPCKPDIFNKTYDKVSDNNFEVSFGVAVAAMESGRKVCRTGWNGKGMYLFIVGTNSAEPGLGKGGWTYTNGVNDNFELLPFIAMKTADEKVVPWLASQTDILAKDWMIVQ